MRSNVSNLGIVVYEADAGASDGMDPVSNLGIINSYDEGPYNAMVPEVYYHERDAGLGLNVLPYGYRTTAQVLDPNGADNPGGMPGTVNRFPFTDNGIRPWEDHNLRGAAPVIPKRAVYGAYGDVGNTDSYSNFYSQAIAQGQQETQTQEAQWALMSQAI